MKVDSIFQLTYIANISQLLKWGVNKTMPWLLFAASWKLSNPSVSVTSEQVFSIGNIHDLPISIAVLAVLVRLSFARREISLAGKSGKQTFRFFNVVSRALLGR